MKIWRKSPLTGKMNTMELDVTEAQVGELAMRDRRTIQEIFPNLPADEREFLLSGYTPADWDAMFKPEEDDDATRTGS
jgi:hypothetical protein